MLNRLVFGCAALTCVLLGLAAGEARGAIVTRIKEISGPGLCPGSVVSNSVATPSPSNDNETNTSPATNMIRIGETPDFQNAHPKQFCKMDYVDVVFDIQALPNNPGTTEYRVTDVAMNLTGRAWTDFHFQLGEGAGKDFKDMDEFLRLAGHAGNAGLDFDFPDQDPPPDSNRFNTIIHQPFDIDMFDGLVAPNDTHFAHFRIDVSDEYAKLSGQFTLREFPTCDGLRNASIDAAQACAVDIPEPPLWSLLGAAFAGLVTARRGRWRRAASIV